MRSQRGNILFLILLAVVLFAALSYAVTSGMRGGGNNASKESAQAAASAIIQYLTMVQSEVQRLMLVNDCTTDNLDWRTGKYVRFDNTAIGTYTATAVTPKTGCAVFSDYGGPVVPQTFEQYTQQSYMTGYAAANTSGWRGGHFASRWANRLNEGTSANDIVLVTDGLRYDICAYMINPNNPPASIPTDAIDVTTQAQATSPATITGGDRIDHALNIVGPYFATEIINGGYNFCRAGIVLISR